MNKMLIVIIGILVAVTAGYTIIDKQNKEEDAKKEKIMECSKIDETEEITIKLFSEVTYQGDYVKSVKTTEEIITSDQETIDFYKTIVENSYEPYKDLEHYSYELTTDEERLVSTTTLDYENIDQEKLIEIDEANEKLIVDGKVSVDDFEEMYSAMEVTCKR